MMQAQNRDVNAHKEESTSCKGQAVTIAVKVCDNINGSQSHKFDFVVAFTVTKMQKVISSLWKLCGDWDPVAMVGAAAK